MKRIILIISAIALVAAMMGISALSSAAQDGALDTGADQYQDEGALDTGDDGALDTDDSSPGDPQCGWYYSTGAGWDPWWEYWCWWPGWGWEFVFWVWA